ncbi:hypothetical protein BaRGS_00010978, partial [Batillaria attramentaria]
LLPFGVGSRSCPGETFGRTRVFLYVTTLLQKFDILPPIKREIPPPDPELRESTQAGLGMVRAVRRVGSVSDCDEGFLFPQLGTPREGDVCQQGKGARYKQQTKDVHWMMYGDGVERFERTVQTELRRLVSRIEDSAGKEMDMDDLLSYSLLCVLIVL